MFRALEALSTASLTVAALNSCLSLISSFSFYASFWLILRLGRTHRHRPPTTFAYRFRHLRSLVHCCENPRRHSRPQQFLLLGRIRHFWRAFPPNFCQGHGCRLRSSAPT